MFFLIVKIAIISLLFIYAIHLIWTYYTKNTDTDISIVNRTNSALQNSKKMYEDMARTIQLNKHSTIDTSIPEISNNSIKLDNEIILDNNAQTDLVKSEENNKKMQEELQEFIDNIT